MRPAAILLTAHQPQLSSYRNAYRSFPTASYSSSSSYSPSSLPYSRHSSSSNSSITSRIANSSFNSSYGSGSNSSANFGTVFRNRPSYDITRTVRSSMDNQFASDVRLQRSINNCIKATTGPFRSLIRVLSPAFWQLCIVKRSDKITYLWKINEGEN